jgi:hypothetical protein
MLPCALTENLLDGVPRPAMTLKPEPSKPGSIVLGWFDFSTYQNMPIGLQHMMALLEEREALLPQMPLATAIYYECSKKKPTRYLRLLKQNVGRVVRANLLVHGVHPLAR